MAIYKTLFTNPQKWFLECKYIYISTWNHIRHTTYINQTWHQLMHLGGGGVCVCGGGGHFDKWQLIFWYEIGYSNGVSVLEYLLSIYRRTVNNKRPNHPIQQARSQYLYFRLNTRQILVYMFVDIEKGTINEFIATESRIASKMILSWGDRTHSDINNIHPIRGIKHDCVIGRRKRKILRWFSAEHVTLLHQDVIIWRHNSS